ncbi:YfhD family protein [Alteribacillus sp. HJP-4]|uniref:YfhD family protein n=1 Tax=Alteribacillus sp. HJP-4 TaxID=2775394 RepID=UPI0035CD0695
MKKENKNKVVHKENIATNEDVEYSEELADENDRKARERSEEADKRAMKKRR